jgi:hypothetical protein
MYGVELEHRVVTECVEDLTLKYTYRNRSDGPIQKAVNNDPVTF